jgi:hypothetical protein
LIGTLVIAVLPANKQQQDQLFSRAATAVHWTTTFCDRNGAACAKAGEILGTLASKAKFGATMSPEDLEPAWRGGPTGAGA